ncbi:MAG: hypothetical protein JWM02_3527 [Frankiales bacterium]|nr:hypothetical protein [Frankiales bacterium]
MTARPLAAALTLVATALTSLLVNTAASASPRPVAGSSVYGGDISWPNCPKGLGIPQRRSQGQPMPVAAAKFVVLGLTNGPAFYPNPCLASQVAWAKARHLWTGAYNITTYPTSAQLARYGGTGAMVSRLRRVGVAAAAFNLDTMRKAGLRVPMIWVDVEHVNGWSWSARPSYNNAFLDGMFARYAAAGIRTGVYSYSYGWREITGGRSLPRTPVWATSGSNTRSAAVARCAARSFSSGPTMLAQWSDGRRDYDITCPGVTGTAGHPNVLTRHQSTRLAQGTKGAAVTALQHRLGATADGWFGPRTRAKVVAFQRSHTLPANGIVDRSVWRALGAGTTTPGHPSKMPALFAST